MLDSFRLWPRVRARLQSGPFAPHLDAVVAVLAERGHSRHAIRLYLHALDVFGGWLPRHGKVLAQVDDVTVAEFVAWAGRRSSPSRRRKIRDVGSRARQAMKLMWERDVVVPPAACPPTTETGRWLRCFDEYLDQVSGATTGTRHNYLRYARALAESNARAGTLDWSKLTADDIVGFVTREAARLKPSGSRLPVTATRAALRFLIATGAVRPGLEGAVPTVRQWSLAPVPRHLQADDLERVIAACGHSTAGELRDRAIVLLLARLGLRASEVARIGLKDIDWCGGRLIIRRDKSRRERSLPLLDEVGAALAAYVRFGRPRRVERGVFLMDRPPFAPLTGESVSRLAGRILRRTGIHVPRPGSHVLRHTAATQMVRRGATFKQVADVLGHAKLETTAIYAKLDLQALARVALAWPEGVR